MLLLRSNIDLSMVKLRSYIRRRVKEVKNIPFILRKFLRNYEARIAQSKLVYSLSLSYTHSPLIRTEV